MEDSLQHRYATKRLRRVLQRVLHVLKDCLLPNSLFDPFLRLNVVRIRVQRHQIGLRLLLSRPRLPQELCEASRVVLCRLSDFGLYL